MDGPFDFWWGKGANPKKKPSMPLTDEKISSAASLKIKANISPGA
jgi:hypothetical protein